MRDGSSEFFLWKREEFILNFLKKILFCSACLLFALSSGCSPSGHFHIKNLSYERIFDKLISLQDTMALIVSSRTGRIIKEAVLFTGVAFLPIGL